MLKIMNKNTAVKRVLFELYSCQEVTKHYLQRVSVGGVCAHSRIGDLRDDYGLIINWRYREVNGKKTKTTLYSLDPSNDMSAVRKILESK